MKIFNKCICLLMTAALLCAVVVLGSCGSESSDQSGAGESGDGTVKYTVTVKDALGNPYSSGIVVKFMQNGEQAAMQACDENGVASKELPSGDYTVELGFTDSEAQYHYESDLALSADKNELDVVLAYKITAEADTLYVQSDEYSAYPVGEGCTYVELTPNDRSYFLFTPARSGNFKFSVADGADVAIGYYGAPHYVQSASAAEVVDNAFTISVSDSMIGSDGSGTSVFVIGIDSADENTENCVFAIERIGDAIKTYVDEPWTVYEATAELSEYKLPEGAVIGEFDLTASSDAYELVFNEADGFYHLGSADGALVLVRLTEDNEYTACFATMLEYSGVVKYFFDEDGEFEKKESYSECLMEYFDYVDEDEGVYPLTEDLKYIIQQRGDYAGWWDIENSSYLFKDQNGNNIPDINSEIAWLLMCCYVE